MTTNKRTIDDALDDFVKRVGHAPQTPMVRAYLLEARRCQSVLKKWETIPPSPEEQDEVIGQVFAVLQQGMGLAPPSRHSKPSPEPSPRPPSRDEGASRRPELGLDKTGPRRIARVELKQVSAAELRAQEALQAAQEAARQLPPEPQPPADAVLEIERGVSLLRTHLLAWEPVAGRPELLVKLVEEDDRGLTAYLRLAPGARLPAHQHHTTEDLLVVEGTVMIAGIEAYPGCWQRSRAGTCSPEIYSPGDCTLLLLGSDRGLLPDRDSRP